MIERRLEDGLLVLTLSRPDKANALTRDMLVQLAEAVEAAAEDTSVRAMILTGEGAAFSAGADLEEARAGLATDAIWERLSGAIATFPVLTVAALNGSAAGGALGMVFACDLRVALPKGVIFYPVMKLGFLPQPSDPGRLAVIAGAGVAKRILLGGERLSMEEARRVGLVDCLSEDVMEEARRLCAASLMAAREHAVAMKAALS